MNIKLSRGKKKDLFNLLFGCKLNLVGRKFIDEKWMNIDGYVKRFIVRNSILYMEMVVW